MLYLTVINIKEWPKEFIGTRGFHTVEFAVNHRRNLQLIMNGTVLKRLLDICTWCLNHFYISEQLLSAFHLVGGYFLGK